MAVKAPFQKIVANEHGLATIEAIPIIIVFTILFAYSYGIFGAIHTGILHSIAARNYAFETFRNRADLTIHRMDGSGIATATHYQKINLRFHAIRSERHSSDSPQDLEFFATERPLAKGLASAPTDEGRNEDAHRMVFSRYDNLSGRSDFDVAPIWIQVGYGICLNSRCEPE